MFILRSPEFGNQFRMDSNLIVHRSSGGTLRTQSRPNAVKFESFVVSFIGLTLEQINDFITFVTQTRGLNITMVDFETRTWYGYITTTPIEVKTVKDGCNYETNFTFEGQVV